MKRKIQKFLEIIFILSNLKYSHNKSFFKSIQTHTWTPIAKKLLDINFIIACHAEVKAKLQL